MEFQSSLITFILGNMINQLLFLSNGVRGGTKELLKFEICSESCQSSAASPLSLMMEEVELCFPHLNTSCWKPKLHFFNFFLNLMVSSGFSAQIIKIILCMLLSFLSRQLHTPTNLLLLSLAVSDFSVGFLWLFQIMLIDGCWFLGDLVCTLYFVLDFIITSTSIGIMILISIDRYVAICDPLHYSTKVTPKRVGVCVSLCWISSFIFLSVLMKDNLSQPGRFNSCAGECVIVLKRTEHVTSLIFYFIAPIITIIVLYMRVFFVAVSQARAMRSQIVFVSYQRSLSVSAKKSEMKAARTLGVVILLFLICTCPYFCVALIGNDSLVSASSSAFVLCLFYLNSSLNPIIYAFFYPWFRKSIRLVVTLKILKPGSCGTNILSNKNNAINQQCEILYNLHSSFVQNAGLLPVAEYFCIATMLLLLKEIIPVLLKPLIRINL
uniref:G-protein coupled receptors family 1 profile domain-containing protein n=1 Tax=Anabas testudineus TaxID=64144 RepID=A0A7N6B4T7_ANATE